MQARLIWEEFGSGPAPPSADTKDLSQCLYILHTLVCLSVPILMSLELTFIADFLDGKHNVVLGGSWATHPRVAGRKTL